MLHPSKAHRIYVDGACRGNPGAAAIGGVIQDSEGKVLHRFKKYLGHSTNNVAEYSALIWALKKAHSLKLQRVLVYTDSQLVAKQVQGEYRVKDEKLKDLVMDVWGLAKSFESFAVVHVPRAQNKEADRLANEALDARQRYSFFKSRG
ncbi:MAG: ribonuclease HI family protein [Candidatus Omnitrophica bacterium]|nr:ribonuclease HI family protein [Candidatus Omnitrophota bacterium]